MSRDMTLQQLGANTNNESIPKMPIIKTLGDPRGRRMKPYCVRFRAPEPTSVEVTAYDKRGAVAIARDLFASIGFDEWLSFARDASAAHVRNWSAVEVARG
jgi:hypothetical protein